MDSTEVTVTIPEQPEDFQCIPPIMLGPGQTMNITAGDFLGVRLLRDAVLPVVGNYHQPSPPSMIEFLQTSATVRTRIDRRAPDVSLIQNHAIHATATIGEINNLCPVATRKKQHH